MWVADVVLRRAARIVPVTLETPAVPTDLHAIDVPAARAQNLANLDRLAALGRERDLRGAFWGDLSIRFTPPCGGSGRTDAKWTA
jgi:hypothetical protein